MKTGITLTGLLAVTMVSIGCTPESGRVNLNQVPASETSSMNECVEMVTTVQSYSDRIKELTKMANDVKAKERPTKPENDGGNVRIPPEVYSKQIYVSEQQKLHTLMVYIVADNPQCFSAADVAEARMLRDALLNK